jgi:hypothetical protein
MADRGSIKRRLLARILSPKEKSRPVLVSPIADESAAFGGESKNKPAGDAADSLGKWIWIADRATEALPAIQLMLRYPLNATAAGVGRGNFDFGMSGISKRLRLRPQMHSTFHFPRVEQLR